MDMAAIEIEVYRTESFDEWLSNLRDSRAVAKITSRIDRLQHGNPGDVSPVGEGVSEMRIHYGPGYRVYYIQHGHFIIVLLCGGSKAGQQGDIKNAISLAAKAKDEFNGY